jgi:hypothetical protein
MKKIAAQGGSDDKNSWAARTGKPLMGFFG